MEHNPSTQDPVAQILLLEDDAPLRERFARILAGWPGGRLVTACATLGEALAALGKQQVDLLLTNLSLPDGHGTEAIRQLRQLNPAADALVISALADEDTVAQAIDTGAAGQLPTDAHSAWLAAAM